MLCLSVVVECCGCVLWLCAVVVCCLWLCVCGCVFMVVFCLFLVEVDCDLALAVEVWIGGSAKEGGG